jgi:NAD+ diphosphatase
MTSSRPNDRSAAVGFSLNPLDRASEKREDGEAIAALKASGRARFLALAGDVPVLKVRDGTYEPLFTTDEVGELGDPDMTIFLGMDAGGSGFFAAGLKQDAASAIGQREGLELVDLRSIAMRDLVPAAFLGELGCAKAMLDWHGRHGFCANCGRPSEARAAGWRRDCGSCNAQHFPRVDPVVIMVAVEGERCLLGRQSRFAPGMYSALAGFLEPGETVEDAVRREIREEAGVPCSRVVYLASQPWPFPSSLMIGCFAKAESEIIAIDRTELEDARWFSREEVSEMFAGTHPHGLMAPQPFAIAHHLLKAFVEEGGAVLDS